MAKTSPFSICVLAFAAVAAYAAILHYFGRTTLDLSAIVMAFVGVPIFISVVRRRRIAEL